MSEYGGQGAAMPDHQFQAISVLRIFDEDKARGFYLNFLGMSVD